MSRCRGRFSARKPGRRHQQEGSIHDRSSVRNQFGFGPRPFGPRTTHPGQPSYPCLCIFSGFARTSIPGACPAMPRLHGSALLFRLRDRASFNSFARRLQTAVFSLLSG